MFLFPLSGKSRHVSRSRLATKAAAFLFPLSGKSRRVPVSA